MNFRRKLASTLTLHKGDFPRRRNDTYISYTDLDARNDSSVWKLQEAAGARDKAYRCLLSGSGRRLPSDAALPQ